MSDRGVFAVIDEHPCSMATVRHAQRLVSADGPPLTVVFGLPRSWLTVFVQATGFGCHYTSDDLVEVVFKNVARQLAPSGAPWDFWVMDPAGTPASRLRREALTVVRPDHREGHLALNLWRRSRTRDEVRQIPCDRSPSRPA